MIAFESLQLPLPLPYICEPSGHFQTSGENPCQSDSDGHGFLLTFVELALRHAHVRAVLAFQGAQGARFSHFKVLKVRPSRGLIIQLSPLGAPLDTTPGTTSRSKEF